MKKNFKLGLVLSIFIVLFSLFAFAPVSENRARANEVSPDNAKGIYDARCAKCHGSNGRGRTIRGKLDHARDFTDAGWQNNVSDERLFNSINNGRGKMPAFKKKLSEQQIDELVTYVRHFKR